MTGRPAPVVLEVSAATGAQAAPGALEALAATGALALTLRGVVQGVGLRPAVHRLATRHGLRGAVANFGGEARIELAGPPTALAAFVRDMPAALPAPARLDALLVEPSGGGAADGTLAGADAGAGRGDPAGVGAHADPADADVTFVVGPSAVEAPPGEAPPDLGPCEACLAETLEGSGRRRGDPFATCGACGPRYTVIEALPYDRERTALAPFPRCAACEAEYLDAADRRFHVEGTACWTCGPRLRFEGPRRLEPGGAPHSAAARAASAAEGWPAAEGPAALEAARALVAAGGLLLLKGVGGYQLACRADDEAAVARLRALKARPRKPLALCVLDVAAAARVAALPPGAAEALRSPARPIVLLPARPGAGLAPGVAPGLDQVGVMLPSSPLHALLLAGAPAPWVLTSANGPGQPLLVDDAAARAAFAPRPGTGPTTGARPAAATREGGAPSGDPLPACADGVLTHDRAIVARADDGVVALHRGRARALRRARGSVPGSLALPVPGPDLVAAGGDLKGALAVVARGRVTLSPHLGDLEHPEVEGAWRDALARLLRLTGARPRLVACDLHPDFVSARLARDLGLPLVPVQHHHAHAAACLAEHGRAGPALAAVLDGFGHGADGQPWGGELLAAGLHAATRLGRLRPVAIPGGDRAAREPWRAALAHLEDAGCALDLPGVPPDLAARARDLSARRVACAPASSAGRLFDAVAALAGVHPAAAGPTTYEGEAAVRLEAAARAGLAAEGLDPAVAPGLAVAGAPDDAYPIALRLDPGPGSPERGAPSSPGSAGAAGRPAAGAAPLALGAPRGLLELDTRPLVRAVVADVRAGAPAPAIALRLHRALARALVAALERLRAETGLSLVVLGGGTFQNGLLLAACEDLLAARGFEVLAPAVFPAGDGGLALGQAAVAAARAAARS